MERDAITELRSGGLDDVSEFAGEIFNISRFAATKHLKGKLSKLRSEVLGSGPLEGSPEPETASMDSAYDMTGW